MACFSMYNNGSVRPYTEVPYGYGSAAGHLAYDSPVYDPKLNCSDSSNSSSKSHSVLGEISPISVVPFDAKCIDPYDNPHFHNMARCGHRYEPNRYSVQRMTRPTSPPELASPFARLTLDDSVEGSGSVYSEVKSSKSGLPVMENGQIIMSFEAILDSDQIEKCARDKSGCTHLQDNYPAKGTSARAKVVDAVLKKPDLFRLLCSDVFGNFFIQCVIKNSTDDEEFLISDLLVSNMYDLCLNRYSCRVVQTAIEKLSLERKAILLEELHSRDLVALAVDQNANHVIQKIMHAFPLHYWAFIIEQFISEPEDLFTVAKNKYGCRVVQLSIEQLSKKSKDECVAHHLLIGLMKHLIDHCENLSQNEFANYVIQHIIKDLHHYRDEIIEKCLLRNLLSMSQEKYASHVVEKALEYAPPHLLKDMMGEIFDGYIPHPETRKDALDIMLFHQYGNYVVQRMLSICVQAARDKSQGKMLCDMELRMRWFSKLEQRINSNRQRLMRYSSGKKILETLDKSPNACSVKREATHRSVPIPQSYR